MFSVKRCMNPTQIAGLIGIFRISGLQFDLAKEFLPTLAQMAMAVLLKQNGQFSGFNHRIRKNTPLKINILHIIPWRWMFRIIFLSFHAWFVGEPAVHLPDVYAHHPWRPVHRISQYHRGRRRIPGARKLFRFNFGMCANGQTKVP